MLYFDGGIRKGQMAYGWILDSIDSKEVIASGNKMCGFGSSNISEYRALIAGLYGGLKAGINIIHIIGDSQLIIKQVNGSFQTKKRELQRHRDRVLELLDQFDNHTIKWVPRHENKRADALVNEIFQRRSGKCPKQQRH